MLAAGDTFRAAAVEQLKVWGERNNVTVIAQGQNADAASVAFDALQAAKARGFDVLIADTAGRLHTQAGLMAELGKIRRVLGKLDPEAPHEVLMVIDGTTGQNALSQLRAFHAAVGVTGLVVTKLDGSAKGGVLFALAREFGIPIRYVGLGESSRTCAFFDPKLSSTRSCRRRPRPDGRSASPPLAVAARHDAVACCSSARCSSTRSSSAHTSRRDPCLGEAGKKRSSAVVFRGTPNMPSVRARGWCCRGFPAATLDGQCFLSAKRAKFPCRGRPSPATNRSYAHRTRRAGCLDCRTAALAGEPAAAPFKLPTLSRGSRCAMATCARATGRCALRARLPHLQAGDPAQLDARGTLLAGKTAALRLDASLATPGLASPLDLKLSCAAARSRQARAAPVRSRCGPLRLADPRFTLRPTSCAGAAIADSELRRQGQLELAASASLSFDAVLTRWPRRGRSCRRARRRRAKPAGALRYRGKRDFSDALSLLAARDDTSLARACAGPSCSSGSPPTRPRRCRRCRAR
jgi:hypothetical protein